MKKQSIFLFLFILCVFCSSISAQKTIKIWKGVENKELSKQKSKLYYYEPDAALKNDCAVIICPGGSYHHLGMPHEGFKTAEWFNSIGVTAFVLRYRVSGKGHHHPAMIEDVQRAIQLVRENAEKYQIDPQKIGVIGFSAGGHLSLMAGEFADDNYLVKKEIQTNVSLRPNFVMPIYPVVSMQDSIAHSWSRKSLLGKNFTKEQMNHFSMELNIPTTMPPVFLLASKNDHVVDVRNSIALDKALTENNIEHKFLLFETGDHGYGMNDTKFAQESQWREQLAQWLREIQMIK